VPPTSGRDGLAMGAHAPEAQRRAFLVTLVSLTFAMNFIARGVPETFAVFLLPVQSGLALSRAEITSTYSVYMLAYGVAAPFAGQLIDRLGARLTYGLGLASLGTGYVLAGSATALWHYVLCVGLLSGFGAALLGMITASALLSRWFVNRLGTVVSLPYAALGAGMLLIPPLTQLLLASFDWRVTHRLLGVGVLATLPIVILLPLSRMAAGSSEWRALRQAVSSHKTGPWTVSAAVRTGAFWGLFVIYLSTSIAAYSILPHSVAYLAERGFPPLLAAGAFGMTGMLSILGILGTGWLSDRFGRRQTATLTYVSTLLGILSLAAITLWPSRVLLYGFVVFFGLVQGARGPIVVALVAKLFAGGGVGGIYGVLSLAAGLGAALGSWMSGLLYQATGTYLASFVLALIGALVGLAGFWVVRSLREERVAPRWAAPSA